MRRRRKFNGSVFDHIVELYSDDDQRKNIKIYCYSYRYKLCNYTKASAKLHFHLIDSDPKGINWFKDAFKLNKPLDYIRGFRSAASIDMGIVYRSDGVDYKRISDSIHCKQKIKRYCN